MAYIICEPCVTTTDTRIFSLDETPAKCTGFIEKNSAYYQG